MLRLTTLLLFSLLYSPIFAQQFQNGDFETLEDCPPVFDFDTSISSTMAHWVSVQGTADGWYEECTALSATDNPSVPPVATGVGYGGYYLSEGLGEELTEHLMQGAEYCITFDAIVGFTGQQDPSESPCYALCVFGTNTPLVPAGGFDIPIPVAEMEDVELLGCSENIPDTENWVERSISFTSPGSYSYLIITGNQEGDCYNEFGYICFDNIAIEQCEGSGTSIAEVDKSEFTIYPNPAASDGLVTLTFTNPSSTSFISLYSMTGQLLRTYSTMGTSRFSLPTNDLARGSYIVALNNGAVLTSEVLVIE